MSILEQTPNQKSDEEKFKDAEELLDFVVIYLPDNGSYKLEEVFAKNNQHFRRRMEACRAQIEELLRRKKIIETGTLNLQLTTTDFGRETKKETVLRLKQEEELIKAQRKEGSFNEMANATLIALLNSSTHIPYVFLNHDLSKVYSNYDVSEIIVEFDRLELLDTNKGKTVGHNSYLLKQPIKRELAGLTKEFDGRPYEYLLSIEENKILKDREKTELELQKLRDEVLDYQGKLRREKNHYKIAVWIAIIEAIGLVLSLWLK